MMMMVLSSTERYSIANNTWEELPDMPEAGHCAVSTIGSEIYVVGGYATRTVDVFDTSSLSWKNPTYLRDMPEVRRYAAAVLVKERYLVQSLVFNTYIHGYDQGTQGSYCSSIGWEDCC